MHSLLHRHLFRKHVAFLSADTEQDISLCIKSLAIRASKGILQGGTRLLWGHQGQAKASFKI
jgi:hypothetical protein